MTRDEYYAEESAYESECEQFAQEEDEFVENGFCNEADYNQWRYGSRSYL